MSVAARLLLCCVGAMWLAVARVQAYKNGPPVANEGICESMRPKHQATPKTDDPPPFEVKFSHDCFKENSQVKVTIEQNLQDDEKFFEGFFTQVRVGGVNSTSYGTFVIDEDFEFKSYVQTLNCFEEQQNAIGHKGARHQEEVSFYWNAPSDLTEDVDFVSTMVRHKAEVWLNVKKTLAYKSDCDAPPPTTPVPGAAFMVTSGVLLPILMACASVTKLLL